MAISRPVNDRRPVNEFSTNRLEFFDLGPETVVDSALLFSESNWHLCALDFKCRDAIFVNAKGGTHLYEAPFLYAELFLHADKVMLVPFAEFLLLAEQAPEPERIIHVLSIGRCGSTLAHHLFRNAPGVLSVSEPDTYIGLTMARFDLGEAESCELLKACSRFHFAAGARRGDHTLVVKHHSQALFQAERFRAAHPAAKFVFMYRDGESWANSVYRMTQSFGFPTVQDRNQREMFWYILSAGQPPESVGPIVSMADENVQADRWIAVLWAIHMIEYLRLWDSDFKMLAVNYRDLNTDRLPTVQRLFAFCGLATDHLENVVTAFNEDSQAGTKLARDNKTASFGPQNYQNFRDTLAKFDLINSGDINLPSLV